MKKSIAIVFFFIFSVSYSYEKADSSRKNLKADCTVSFNSNGISSIPAFSLGKPAIVAAIGLAKGRFSFDPTLAYGLDIRPWYIDSWLHYRLIDKSKFRLRTGINFSNFFSDYPLPEHAPILQGQRYWAIELAAFYYFPDRSNISLMYWNDRGQDPGTLLGHFISLTGEWAEINISKKVFLTASLQIFYINYDGDNDGLFIAPKIASSVRDLPFSIFIQATQAITSNISPFPGFKWNAGLSYTF
jgi:hypothetical protein